MHLISFFKAIFFLLYYLVGQVKDGNNISGNARKSCSLYEEIDQILGTQAVSCPPVVVEGGEGVSSANVDVPAFEEHVSNRERKLELEIKIRYREDK